MAKTVKFPKDDAFKNVQLSLFQDFLCNTDEQRAELSNTIELWDALPKYSISQTKMNEVRGIDGDLPPMVKECRYKGLECRLTLRPAQLVRESAEQYNKLVFNHNDDKNRAYKAFYPSANEELIEESLRKLAAEQTLGFFDANDPAIAAGVQFTLHMLRAEMKKQGHTRSYYELMKSLRILSDSRITIDRGDGTGELTAPYFPVLARVSNGNASDDPRAKWFVRFHPLVTQSVKNLAYRQYNYALMMSHSSQLARWLHKLLAHNYTNASPSTPYGVLLSSIKRDSGLLEQSKPFAQRRKFETALKELKENNVIMTWQSDVSRGARNAIEDIKYSLTPTRQFVTEVVAANRRNRDADFQLRQGKKR